MLLTNMANSRPVFSYTGVLHSYMFEVIELWLFLVCLMVSTYKNLDNLHALLFGDHQDENFSLTVTSQYYFINSFLSCHIPPHKALRWKTFPR